MATFVPGTAPSERKAKLLALSSRLDEHYATRFAEARATGAVVGIVMDGELVYRGSFGVRDVASKVPADSDTVFRIGSLSKSFAATAILKLRDEGKLELDTPAARYVPEVSGFHGAPPDAVAMTVRHLLTMTSGLAYDDTWGPVSFGHDEREFAQFLAQGVTLANAPGEVMAYSNLGYALLGKIVERVSGQTFRAYVDGNVLAPLGMASTGWKPTSGRMAVGYYRRGQELLPEPHPDDGVFAPAGGIYSTLHDFARYVAFQLSAYGDSSAREAAPLRRATLREMHLGHAWMRWGHDVPVARRDEGGHLALMASSYGFGWVNHTTCAYEGLVQHGGYEPGYFSFVRLLPKQRLGFIAFAATSSIGDWKTFEGALALLQAGGVLDGAQPVAPPLLRAQDNVNRLLARWEEALAGETFDPVSLRYSWFSTIGEDLARLGREHGPCRPEGELQASSATQASWRMACERGRVDFSLWLNPATRPRVQHLTWKEHPATGESMGKDPPPLARPHAPCSE